jgi:hypothetical protein
MPRCSQKGGPRAVNCIYVFQSLRLQAKTPIDLNPITARIVHLYAFMVTDVSTSPFLHWRCRIQVPSKRLPPSTPQSKFSTSRKFHGDMWGSHGDEWLLGCGAVDTGIHWPTLQIYQTTRCNILGDSHRLRFHTSHSVHTELPGSVHWETSRPPFSLL